MARKGHPEKVSPDYALMAIRKAEIITHAWTEYIVAHYRATGHLAPGCDAVDFYAWWDAYNSRKLVAEPKEAKQ